MTDNLQDGREAFERRAWEAAFQSLLRVERVHGLEPDDLDRLATAAYLTGRDSEFQRTLERLVRLHLDAGRPAPAARAAFWLGLTLLFRGEVGQSSAWVSRGQRAIEGLDCVEHGYLVLHGVELQLHTGRAAEACAAAKAAVEIGERFGDADLAAIARHVEGRALLQLGRVLDGLARLDETMLAVIGGELSPIVTGLMYCSVIDACRSVYALSRAREWTSALSHWCEQQSSMVAFTGTCLVHRAEIMEFHGAWHDALAEASRACEPSRTGERRPPAAAFYRQAEIHRLRGEFAEAEDAYQAASRSGFDPQPGLALLRLAQGRTDAASAAIRRLVSGTVDRALRGRQLPACVEIMLAIGDVETACGAADELDELAEGFDTDVLRATAAQARGAIALADGDALSALAPLRRAFDLWTRLEAPYEAARVRVHLGLACRTLGDQEAASLEFGAARATLAELGARPELARLEKVDSQPRSAAHPLTSREREVLRLVALGETNKAIAARLSLSERTVDRHVSNILTKLSVPSRAAATAYAYDHKLF